MNDKPEKKPDDNSNPAEKNTDTQTKKSRVRLFLLPIRILLPLMLILSVLFAFMVTTQPGLRLTLFITKTFLPGKLTIEKVEGTLTSIVHFRKLSYQSEGVNLTIDDLEFDWQPSSLLRGRLAFNYLNATKTVIKFKESAYETGKKRQILIYIPFELELHKINFKRLTLQTSPEEKPIFLQSLTINKSIFANDYFMLAVKSKFELPETWLEYPLLQTELYLEGSIHDYELTLRVKNRALDWTLQGKGDKKHIAFTTAKDNALRGQLQLLGKLQWFPIIEWNANLTGKHINFGSQWPILESNMSFVVHGQGKHFDGEIEISQFEGKLHNYPIQGQAKYVFKDGSRSSVFDGHFNLGSALFQLQGQLTDLWDIQWNFAAPSINVFAKTASGSLHFTGKIEGPKRNPNLLINGQMQNLAVNNKRLADLVELHAEGSLFQGHTLSALWKIKQQQVQAAMQGLLQVPHNQPPYWQGQLTALNFNHLKLGTWRLKQAAPVQISAKQFTLAPLCWLSTGQQICLQGKLQRSVSPKTRKTKKAQIITALSGQLKAELTRLTLINNLIPKLKNLRGKITADLQLGGNLSQPQATGKIAFNGAGNLPNYGLNLSPIQININAEKNRLNYLAKIYSNGRSLAITGNTDLTASDFPTKLQLQGTEIPIYNTIQYQIYVNPTLQVQTQGTNINVTGKIFVPHASITPHEFDKTVSLPPEVIFVRDHQIQKPTISFDIDSQVELILGDNIKLDAFDLIGKIKGHLMITDVTNQATSAHGHLEIVDGSYSTYDTTLQIRKGYLEFKGGPITNPFLNVQAVREVHGMSRGRGSLATGKYVVGVNVTGTARKPHKSLFSQPSGLSQQQIMSYLVFGSKSLAPRVHVSYGIDYLEQPTTTVRIQYDINDHWSIQSETSSVGNGIDLLYNIEKD